MLEQIAVWFEWPFPPNKGNTVRFFKPIGPLHISMWGPVWRVCDERVKNPHGGPDWGVEFATLKEVEQYLNLRILQG